MLEVFAKFQRKCQHVPLFEARGKSLQAYQVHIRRSRLFPAGSVGRYYAKQITWD
jgi:hypothetical protein